jgi:hypothetical protein
MRASRRVREGRRPDEIRYYLGIPLAVELDHRPGEEKLFHPYEGRRYPWEKLEAEVAKCDVRCAACHCKRHISERTRCVCGRFCKGTDTLCKFCKVATQ